VFDGTSLGPSHVVIGRFVSMKLMTGCTIGVGRSPGLSAVVWCAAARW
jgi:hypothetical protein